MLVSRSRDKVGFCREIHAKTLPKPVRPSKNGSSALTSALNSH